MEGQICSNDDEFHNYASDVLDTLTSTIVIYEGRAKNQDSEDEAPTITIQNSGHNTKFHLLFLSASHHLYNYQLIPEPTSNFIIAWCNRNPTVVQH